MSKFWVGDGKVLGGRWESGQSFYCRWFGTWEEEEPKVTKSFGMRIRVEEQDGEVQPHVSKTGTFAHFSLQNYLQLFKTSSGSLGLSPATI